MLYSVKNNFPVRIYYEDTDAGGVVYHARYLHFFERARTEYLRALSYSQQKLLTEDDIIFVVKKMTLDFSFPAKLDDLLNVVTQVTAVKGASILFKQSLMRNELILCEATVKVACVNFSKMKPIAIPASIRTALLK